MKILAIDPGDSKFGFAISDEFKITATPLPIISTKDFFSNPQYINADLEKILIGKPSNPKSDIYDLTFDYVSKFVMDQNLAIKVEFVNEDYSTKTAKSILYSKSRKKNKQKKLASTGLNDSVAACVILQDYLG